MTDALRQKLKTLPKTPGVYFHKNASGEIIYVGKAARLNNRVRQYFQKSRLRDTKTDLLVAEIADTDWMEVSSEIEALFLEAEMVRRYMPKYNILLRDDKSYTYIRVAVQDPFPSVTTTRRPLDDGAKYFGPYPNSLSVRRSLHYLRRIFPYSTHTSLPSRACLQQHIGLCPGPETGNLDQAVYRATLAKLMLYFKGERASLEKQLEKEMSSQAAAQNFEAAAQLRNQLYALKNLRQRIIFGDKEQLDLSKDHALQDLVDLLGLTAAPRRIEGYDISHMQGTDNVASMVVFSNGVADKHEYRKFKMRLPGNDDFLHMQEVIKRRFQAKNIKAWGMPSLLLIDGGKGQLAAALTGAQHHDIEVPAIGLAKKFEEIIVRKPIKQLRGSNCQLNQASLQSLGGYIKESDEFITVVLPQDSHIIKLLQRIRDESHRFAVSYHSTLKTKRQTASVMDDIPGVGPVTRKQLIRAFGSLRALKTVSQAEIATVVGPKKAKTVYDYLAKLAD